MTELLQGGAQVRLDPHGALAAVSRGGSWRRVQEVVARWRVDTDWWRVAVRRDYVRCLLDDGDCVELYRDRADGSWQWVRRHD